ncbi:MAG TPA: hypothetical protein VD905_06345, partial [Flavobacteriales bacterium]|nr:hypothetical protein [Flavobacteriales bacterium]
MKFSVTGGPAFGWKVQGWGISGVTALNNLAKNVRFEVGEVCSKTLCLQALRPKPQTSNLKP